MKKVIITIIIALATGFGAWAGKTNGIYNLVNQYRGSEGFEVVSVGRIGTSLIKGAIRLSSDMDAEDRQALSIFSDIKRIEIVNFEDSPAAVKERFTGKLERLLNKMELILEASDDGERVRIYGIEDGDRVKDCILYSSDGALIITEGGIDFDKVARLMDLQNQ